MPIALQGLLGDNIWILIPLAALMIPIVAILGSTLTDPLRERMRVAERREARKLFERLALEKLDVIKTGIAMGYSQNDLRELDARLERLIGTDKLKGLLEGDPKKAVSSIESLDLESRSELELLARRVKN